MFVRLYPSEKLLYVPIEAQHINFITSKFQFARFKTSEHAVNMQLSPKSLAGPGYIILNAIRVMNIIGFLAVITASVLMLVKTSATSSLFFFEAVSHFITAVTSMFLIISELSLFRGYFARNWPLLSPSHGFVMLASTMIVLGINVMGNLNTPAGSRKQLGIAFWRIVISSGIIIFILGWVNLIASYIFRDRAKGITARQVRAHGAVAVHKTPITSEYGTPPAPVLAQSYISQSNSSTPSKSSNAFRIVTTERRDSTLPLYSAPQTTPPTKDPVSPSSKYSRATVCTKKKVWDNLWSRNSRRESLAPPLPIHVDREMQISAPMGINPQFAHLVQRPDSALHPSRTGESEAFRWRAN